MKNRIAEERDFLQTIADELGPEEWLTRLSIETRIEELDEEEDASDDAPEPEWFLMTCVESVRAGDVCTVRLERVLASADVHSLVIELPAEFSPKKGEAVRLLAPIVSVPVEVV